MNKDTILARLSAWRAQIVRRNVSDHPFPGLDREKIQLQPAEKRLFVVAVLLAAISVAAGIGYLMADSGPSSPSSVFHEKNFLSVSQETWLETLLVASLLTASSFLAVWLWWRFVATSRLAERKAEQLRRALADRLSLVTRYANDIILISDSSWHILYANERACEAYGYSDEEIRNLTVAQLCSPAGLGIYETSAETLIRKGQLVYETEHRHRNGTVFAVEVSSRMAELEGRVCHLAAIRDISLRKAHEREIERLNMLYGALVQLNQMMARVDSQEELLSSVCSILAEQGGFRLVWIGHCDSVSGRVRPVACCGAAEHFLDDLDIRIGEGPRFSSPTYVALREGRGDVCRDFDEPRIAPWREKMLAQGFKASAAFPIHRGKRIWGNLTVYSSAPGVLGDKECALLEETANDISYALAVIDDRSAQKRIENALRDSEKHFHSLFDTVSEVIAIHELVFGEDGRPCDYRITACNPSYARIIGIPRERAIGALASELYGAGHAPYLAEFSSVAITGEPFEFDTYFPPLGKYFHISVVAPGPGRFATVSTDITLRKQTETELRESEARFRSTFEQAATGIAHVSLDGKFLRVNQRLCSLMGYSQEEMMRMHFQDVTYAEDLSTDEENVRQLLDGIVQTYSVEKRYLANGGRVLWAQLTASLVHLPNGTPHYFIVVIQDIAERKQAEAALRESESRYRRLTQAVTDYVYSVEITDGRPTNTTHGAGCHAITGYSPEDFKADPYLWLRMVVDEDRHVVLDQVEALLANRDSLPIEHRIMRKDGTLRWVRNTTSAHRNVQGLLLSYDGLVQDVTERKIADQQLREANAKLQTYATQMEMLVKGRTAELEATNRELEAFSYSVSHDLRAPLRAIDGFTRILSEDYSQVLDEEGRRLLKVVGTESQRMGRLIDDLLSFSRMGRHALKPEMLDVAQLVIEVRDELMARDPGHRVQWNIGPLPPVCADPAFLRQVLLNLMGNAMKYSKKRDLAVVDISGSLQGGETVFVIKDNGAGFDMKYAGKLFGVFQRLHSDAEFEGNGVGLALVQRIIHRHGGRVWAEGTPGVGASFYFSLPNQDVSSMGSI